MALYLLRHVVSLMERLASAHDRALLGDWYFYGLFQAKDGAQFYKEKVSIRRNPVVPWRLIIESKAMTNGTSVRYRGTIVSHPPFLYCSGFDPIYHDRTFEILQRKMDAQLHDAEMFVGIHLGKTYEDTIVGASAVVMARSELYSNPSQKRVAETEVEKARFLEIIRPYFKTDRTTYQLLQF